VHPETKAIVLAMGLLGAMAVVVWWMGVPFVVQTPGPTYNVLGNNDVGKPIIQISGATDYPDTGTLRMVTVSVTSPGQKVSMPEAMLAWLAPGNALFPMSFFYPPTTSTQDQIAQGQIEMVSSQDSAVAAALTALGYSYTERVGVVYVEPGKPADGLLEAKDEILAIDGTAITSAKQFVSVMAGYKPGDKITVTYLRDGKTGTVHLTLGANPDDPSKPLMGVYAGTIYHFPVNVTINVDPNIGGPSAGLVLSLAIYDQLTPGSLVGNVPIAGTGTIDADGKVGPIGGIQQKIRAASEAGAKLFLVPAGDCADALNADPVAPITLVKVDTMQSAIDSIEKYVANPSATLPGCAS
jgi:PDZ domain-containing protein